MPTTDPWTDLCAAADVKPGVGLYLEHGNRRLAVWRVDANGNVSSHDDPAAFRVMDDACPHAGGSLSAGSLDDGCVICPWHGWAFSVDSGACPDNAAYRVRVYDVRVENGRVFARL